MAIRFIINNTVGGQNPSQGGVGITINAGRLNGPGGAERNSDLRLYGYGTTQWGEGVNENFYRMAENFACPEKELNDYNPATSSNDYDPATDPLLPKDEHDLGFGNGISHPLDGQLWFNTTQKKIFLYDGSTWDSLGGAVADSVAPTSPNVGDLWYETPSNQLKAYNGATWDPVAAEYLLLDGTSTMAGNLDVGGYRVINVGTPTNPTDAVNLEYLSTTYSADVLLVDGSNQMTYNLDAGNFKVINLATPTNPADATTKQYVDNKFVEIAGDTMTGFLTLNADPVNTLHAATKQYVDDQITTLSSTFSVLPTVGTFYWGNAQDGTVVDSLPSTTRSGVYEFDTYTLATGSTLNVDPTVGYLVIFAKTSITLQSGSVINAAGIAPETSYPVSASGGGGGGGSDGCAQNGFAGAAAYAPSSSPLTSAAPGGAGGCNRAGFIGSNADTSYYTAMNSALTARSWNMVVSSDYGTLRDIQNTNYLGLNISNGMDIPIMFGGTGGYGGYGGGSPVPGTGGAGGVGGGCVILVSPSITVDGATINVAGADGVPGLRSGDGGGGAGGSGGGGLVALIYSTGLSETSTIYTINGGVVVQAPAGGNHGGAGGLGASGQVVKKQQV